MKRSTVRWTPAIAVAALLAVPSSGLAQTATPPQTPPAASMQSEQPDSPQAHLRKAEEALNGIAPAAVTGQNKTRINDIKQRINKLEKAVAEDQAAGAAAQSQAAAKIQWDKEVAEIDRILTQLIGPDTGAASATSATGTTGAVGTSGSTRAEGNLDAAAQAKLHEVRTHITAFATAMGKGGSEQAASAAGAAGTSGTSGSMTGATGSAAGTTSTQPPATSQTTQPGQSTQPQSAQVDAEAAKQHLTAARNSLSEMTQLPAAAQLTGEARTQITQLISNFNELITTNAQWRASYAKIEANLTALLGSETTDESAARAASSGTAGAVGTSGTAGAVDPGIRAKLVEFRNHLEKFEQAAGGPKPESEPSAAAAGTTSGTAGTASGMTSSGSTMSSTGSTAAGTASAQQGTGAQTSQSAQGEQVDRVELLRHVQAIETLLQASGAGASGTAGTAGTSGSTTGSTATGTTQGGVTLTPAQVDQLRNHLNELKRLLNQR